MIRSLAELDHVPVQRDLGLNVGPSRVSPAWLPKEFNINSTRIDVVAERVAAQHLLDGGEEYFRMPIARRAEIHRSWIRLAELNTELTAKISGVQKAMKESRRLKYLDEWRVQFYEPHERDFREAIDVYNSSFTMDVENAGTGTLVEDVLRVNAAKHWDLLYAEDEWEFELKLAFPELVSEPDGLYELPGISPANIFQKILEGRITLEGSGIKSTIPDPDKV